MGHTIDVDFGTVVLQFEGGVPVAIPLFDRELMGVGLGSAQLASQFAAAFQAKVMNKGAYEHLLQYVARGELKEGVCKVHFAGHKGRLLYPPLDLAFSYLYRSVEGKGVWATVPVLGIEAFSEKAEELEHIVGQSIMLEFARKKRLSDIELVIEALWLTQPVYRVETVQLMAHTPAELAELNERTRQKLLPKVAKQLQVHEQQSFGRADELEQLVRLLKGQFNKNILLVGRSGVGKTALVWDLARVAYKMGIVQGIWETTASTLIKELTMDTGWEDNLAHLCKEIARQGDFLYVRNLMELFEVGQYEGNSVSMAEYLKSYLQRGEVTLLSECTEEEYARIEVRVPGYLSLFQVIRLEEPAKLEAVIEAKIKLLAKRERVRIEQEAILETIRLNKRFNPYSGYPGKPVRFLESMFVAGHLSKQQKEGIRISRSDVIRQFCEESGMPAFLVDPEIPLDLAQAQHFFEDNLFGQPQAVRSTVNIIASVKTALVRSGKPIASMLFVGPTGVGKTELAKLLAQYVFGSRDRLARFDMSEYSDPWSVMRLVGNGYGEDGTLTAAIRRMPFCLLLFDEIEKANPAFFDLLLQILDEGRLTDSSGKLVNFCSTIIIMTSNIGASHLQMSKIGWKDQVNTQVSEHFISAVQKHFRPELYNRIGEIIPFDPLDATTIQQVVQREITLLRQREGIQHRPVALTIQPEVYQYLSQQGYHPRYGARNLQRTLRDQLVIPLASALNQYEYNEQLEIVISIQQETIHIDLHTDPLKMELLLEELTRNEFAELAAELTRHIHRLTEGSYFIQLQSQLDLLEEDKRDLKEAFWKDSSKVYRHKFLTDTRTRCQELTTEIAQIEMELALAIHALKPYRPATIDTIKAWQKKYLLFKKELFARIHDEGDDCLIAVFGKQPLQIIQLYRDLAHKLNFTVSEIKLLWYREAYYHEKIQEKDKEPTERKEYLDIPYQWGEPIVPQHPNDLLVGAQIAIEGSTCYYHFQHEDGVHSYPNPDDKTNSLYHIITDDYEINHPENVFRLTYFDKLKPRRTYKNNTLHDPAINTRNKTYNSYPELIELLETALTELFEQQIEKNIM